MIFRATAKDPAKALAKDPEMAAAAAVLESPRLGHRDPAKLVACVPVLSLLGTASDTVLIRTASLFGWLVAALTPARAAQAKVA